MIGRTGFAQQIEEHGSESIAFWSQLHGLGCIAIRDVCHWAAAHVSPYIWLWSIRRCRGGYRSRTSLHLPMRENQDVEKVLCRSTAEWTCMMWKRKWERAQRRGTVHGWAARARAAGRLCDEVIDRTIKPKHSYCPDLVYHSCGHSDNLVTYPHCSFPCAVISLTTALPRTFNFLAKATASWACILASFVL